MNTDKQTSTQLPCEPAIERSLVGTCLLWPADSMAKCTQFLNATAFMEPTARAMWGVMELLYREGRAFDLPIVTYELQQTGELAKVGGPGALAEVLEEAAPTTTLLDDYITRLCALRQRRQLIAVAAALDAESRDGTLSPDEILTRAQGGLIDILGAGSKEARTNKDIMLDVMRDLDQASRNRGQVTRGLATGYADLDRQLMGLRPKYLYVIGARPSMGKSTLLVNIAENIALSGNGVLLFTLEMPDVDIGTRMAVGGAGVDLQKARSGMFSRMEWSSIIERCKRLATSPMWVYDTPGLTIGEIRARTRVMLQKHPGIKAVFVDYLQLIKGESKRAMQNRYLEVGEVSKGLKNIAMEMGVAVITAAQLNRGAEERKDHKPLMADLRESGDIEQDADVIALLRRPGYYSRGDDDVDDGGDKDPTAYLDIVKHRNGPVGECEFQFIDCQTRFVDAPEKKLYGQTHYNPDGSKRGRGRPRKDSNN